MKGAHYANVCHVMAMHVSDFKKTNCLMVERDSVVGKSFLAFLLEFKHY